MGAYSKRSDADAGVTGADIVAFDKSAPVEAGIIETGSSAEGSEEAGTSAEGSEETGSSAEGLLEIESVVVCSMESGFADSSPEEFEMACSDCVSSSSMIDPPYLVCIGAMLNRYRV